MGIRKLMSIEYLKIIDLIKRRKPNGISSITRCSRTEKRPYKNYTAVSTSIGQLGKFSLHKDLLDEVTSISSEQELVSKFGKPTSSNFEDFLRC